MIFLRLLLFFFFEKKAVITWAIASAGVDKAAGIREHEEAVDPEAEGAEAGGGVVCLLYDEAEADRLCAANVAHGGAAVAGRPIGAAAAVVDAGEEATARLRALLLQRIVRSHHHHHHHA